MSIDASKLTPKSNNPSAQWRHSQMSPEDWKLYELARNAFDVMMRRGWSAIKVNGENKWYCLLTAMNGNVVAFDDPFTALVEADAWYVANVEDK